MILLSAPNIKFKILWQTGALTSHFPFLQEQLYRRLHLRPLRAVSVNPPTALVIKSPVTATVKFPALQVQPWLSYHFSPRTGTGRLHLRPFLGGSLQFSLYWLFCQLTVSVKVDIDLKLSVPRLPDVAEENELMPRDLVTYNEWSPPPEDRFLPFGSQRSHQIGLHGSQMEIGPFHQNKPSNPHPASRGEVEARQGLSSASATNLSVLLRCMCQQLPS